MTRFTTPCGVHLWLGAAAMVSVLFMAVPVRAQPAPGEWEIEFHGGGGPVSSATDGTANLPAAGPPFTTVVGTTSRRTSSWYFGDGAILLNQVNAALGVTQRITPLDPVFAAFSGQSATGRQLWLPREPGDLSSIQCRVHVRLCTRPADTEPASVLAGIEAARASFVPAWTALIANDPFVGPTVTSVSTIHDRAGRQTFTTAALNINLKTSGNIIPVCHCRWRLHNPDG